MNISSPTAWSRSLLVVGLVLVVALTGQAQPGSGGTAPTPTPLDGGASLLLTSGVAYAVRQLRTRRRTFRRNRA